MTGLALDTTSAIEWYRRNRTRSEAIFDLIDPSAYYSRPISLRNPIVFYEGHLPAFSVIAFLRRGLGRPPVDTRLESLFERGIDPESEASAVPRSGASTSWPSRDEVRAFARACDEAIVTAMRSLSNDAIPLEGLYTALEHEAMHQETLLYMWHRLAYNLKRLPSQEIGRSGDQEKSDHEKSSLLSPEQLNSRKHVPPGTATLGVSRGEIPFGWDNEFEAHRVTVDAFDVDAFPVINAQFLEFVNGGGYAQRDLWDDEGWEWIQKEKVTHPAFWISRSSSFSWRGMFGEIPLPADWPVYVSHAEASAYARWKGRRLMTEPEFHRAAYSAPHGSERAHPWGDAPPDATRGNFDFAGFDPTSVAAHPAGASAWGVHDLVGNGWEWTSTVFAPFDGFAPMRSYPEYSADFFDGRHYVMKGASPATAKELVRRSFRNWFRGNYPYVYAKFRTAQ
ncbi:MAG TPA: SUMF1/EgtB/PvdO family nonheme iron enzyme [Vicinamibacterales bacterium]|nr:SUMF1/EgtB/PvdO family nonheme iron enzyme [Vicinamibacterales bacterium]